MKITKATHKAFLYGLFTIDTPQGKRQREFPIEKITIASSIARKLLEESTKTETAIQFVDKDLEFTADEWVLLKEMFSTKKNATVGEAEVFIELKELFKQS